MNGRMQQLRDMFRRRSANPDFFGVHRRERGLQAGRRSRTVEPMPNDLRIKHYLEQTGGSTLTVTQARRVRKHASRWES